MIDVIALFIVVALLAQDFLLGFSILFNFYRFPVEGEGAKPFVSILIPSRNEEKNLPRCLHALNQLDYPADRMEIILGDDRSSDRTWEILEDWGRNKDYVKVLAIKEGDSEKINGKANALAQMVKESKGGLLLFTDADCVVRAGWVSSMVEAQVSSQAGLVTGITSVDARNLFSRMQGIDWWLTLGMVKVLSDWGSTVTAMGNNMLVSRGAYEAVGGFEGLDFSLTEDFEMGKAIRERGFRAIHLVARENLIETQAVAGFGRLMQQRKRWMHGAMQLPGFWKSMLTLRVAFFPAAILLVFLHPFEGTALWLFKVLIQSLFIYHFASKTGSRLRIVEFLLFEIYYFISAWSTIVYYFWPAKTDWKGRKYG